MTEEEMQRQRFHLFDLLDRITTPQDAFDFQVTLSKYIIAAERLYTVEISKHQKLEYKWHIQSCRLYGDCLARNLFDKHVIRQLAKFTVKPPKLITLGDVLDKYFDVLDLLTQNGEYGIICDLTNLLGLADIAISIDSERPTLFEVKGDKIYIIGPTRHESKDQDTKLLVPDHITKRGRLGRQLSRMKGVSEYLRTGSAKVFGESFEWMSVEVSEKNHYHWSILQTAIDEALNSKFHVINVSDSQIIIAVNNLYEIDWKDVLRKHFNSKDPDELHLIVGSHLTAMNDQLSTVAPPFIWDLSRSARFALMEGDIELVNIINLKAFYNYTFMDSRIVEINLENQEDQFGVTVDIGGNRFDMSNRFIFDALYGFETIESVSNQVIRSAIEVARLLRSEDD